MNYDIYCDESGNTGSNYLDINQPFYVLSGWMVERNLSYRAKNRVEMLKEKSYPQAQELKGSKLLKNQKGRRFCSELVYGEMGKANCTPFFIVAEKKFAIAGKMVESFFDPAYNNHVKNSFSWMNAQKKKIAQIICDISEGSIEKYASAHSNPSLVTIKESYLQLLNEMDKNGFKDLVYALEGVSQNLQDIFDEEVHTINAVEKNVMHTLNYPVFISFIQLIERFSRVNNLKKVRIIHDEVAQFQRAYPEVFNQYSSSTNKEELFLENGASILFSTEKIKMFQMEDSKKLPLIQSADILSSTINYYFTKIHKGENIPEELKAVGEFLVRSYLLKDFGRIEFCDYIGSSNPLKEMFKENGIGNSECNKSLSEIDIRPYLVT